MPKDYSIGYKFKGDASGFKKATGEMSLAIKEFGGVLLGASGLLAIMRFTAESVKLAAASEGIKTAFSRIGGSKKVLDDIKKSTRGVIDEADLMGIAMKAQNFGVPLKELARMLEFSTNRAITTGNSITEFANKFVEGVGRRMPKSLIALQISASDAKEMFSKQGLGGTLEYANEQLAEMGTVADTAGVQIARFGASWKDIKENIGESIIKGETFKEMMGWLENLNTAANDPRITKPGMALKMMRPSNYQAFVRGNEAIYGAGLGAMPGALTGSKRWEGFSVPQKVIETITTLNEQLKDEKEYLLNIDITDKVAIQTQLQVIDVLEKRIKELSKFKDAIKSTEKEIERVYQKTSVKFTDVRQIVGGGMARGGGNLAGAPGTQEEIDRANETIIEGIGIVNDLQSAFENLFANTGEGFKGMAIAFGNALKQMVAQLMAKAAIFGILTLLSGGTGAIGGWASKVLGGKTFGKFMGFASGTNFAPGGLSLVGERGPELVNLPRGSQVIPMRNQKMTIEVVGKLKAKDIQFALSRYNAELYSNT